eukprot:6178959-Prymnesium_polylepis.1
MGPVDCSFACGPAFFCLTEGWGGRARRAARRSLSVCRSCTTLRASYACKRWDQGEMSRCVDADPAHSHAPESPPKPS